MRGGAEDSGLMDCTPAEGKKCIARYGSAGLSDNDTCLGCDRSPEELLRELASKVTQPLVIIDDVSPLPEESESQPQ